MLQYFYKYPNLNQIDLICKQLDSLKKRLLSNNFEDAFREFESCQLAFNEIDLFSKSINNEKLANSNYVFKCYFSLFCHLMLYFDSLQNTKYKDSWYLLQDCINDIHHIGRFTEERLEITSLLNLLSLYESLYPYKLFLSSEYIIEKSYCSICGKSMQRLDCNHIKGNLYWGKLAFERIEKIKELQAVSVVTHPKNKKCIFEPQNNNRTEVEKFQLLSNFLKIGVPFFQMFELKTHDIHKPAKYTTKRNDRCPCGSGIKFKKCCGKELIVNYKYYKVEPRDKVQLYFFNMTI